MPIRGTKIRRAIGAVSVLAQISLLTRDARWQRRQSCCVCFLFVFGFDKEKKKRKKECGTKIKMKKGIKLFDLVTGSLRVDVLKG